MRRTDIKDVLRLLGSEKFIDSGESVQTNCILARWTHQSGKDSRPSLGVKEEQGMSYCHCFTCGFSGGLLSLVREYSKHALPEGLINDEQVKQIIDFIFVAEDEEVTLPVITTEKVSPPDHMVESLGVWNDYFSRRGIALETFEKWNLGYHDGTQRVLFPVYDDKEIVGIVGRTVVDDGVKWKNYPSKFKKSHCLMGLHLKQDQKKLVVVEGPIDVVKVNEALKNHPDFWCVGTLGAEPSKIQMQLLVENAEEVIIMYDNDASGKRGRKSLIDTLSDRVVLSVVEYPDGVKDPDEAGEAVIEMLDNRKVFLEWKIEHILRRDTLGKGGVH